MLNTQEVAKALELQQRSFHLLKWINKSVRNESLGFTEIHQALSTSDASLAWLRRWLPSIPGDARPEADDLPAFASLLASYLTTSFEVMRDPKPIRVGCCGCNWCSYFIPGNHLKPRAVSDNARQQARTLKTYFLEKLAQEAGLPLTPELTTRLFKDPASRLDLAFATYGYELLRRTYAAGQGPAVLSIWREIAWENNGPKKDFKLTAKDVMSAEARLIKALQGR